MILRLHDAICLPFLSRPLEHGQCMRFGIVHPFLERERILVREQEIEVFERFRQKVAMADRSE